ncbi:hypothetical protein OU671_23095, partial [Escherichia coli]|nr:hypothetical protein [Escherichia coli]
MTERVAITEGHLFRVAFAIFFQLSQAAEFQDVPLFPGVFFGTVAKLAMRQPFVLFKGLTFQKLCL